MTTSSNAVKLPSNGDGLTAAALDELAQRLAPVVAQHLVNCIDVGNAPLQKGSDPTMKINRVVTINGEKRWIHANTEQEYAEKLMQLCGGMQQAPAQRHNFADYAEIAPILGISEVSCRSRFFRAKAHFLLLTKKNKFFRNDATFLPLTETVYTGRCLVYARDV